LLEDDPNLAKTLVKYLELNGYFVDWAKHGEEALDFSYENQYILYLFDVNVPLINGVDLLKSLRDAEDFTPTIIVSAQIDISSVTKGFIAGADDYVKKPFDPEELLVRIQAKTDVLKETIVCKDYVLDLNKQEITYKGEILYIGDVQRNIFIKLLQNHPNPVIKDALLDCLEKPTDLALRVNMAKLKKNIKLNIASVRGVGYKIL
jgi:DNA-binding response OmpR family regulator